MCRKPSAFLRFFAVKRKNRIAMKIERKCMVAEHNGQYVSSTIERRAYKVICNMRFIFPISR
ncbi:hypothetical protein LP7551_02551 [Roseibium album]|nr:hypothetical protein LP7551_02551 [Roseibium album]